MKKKYKLKNKRRFYTFITVLSIIIFTFLLITLSFGKSTDVYKKIEVNSGDNLWKIALKHNYDKIDIRDLIEKIKEKNNLTSAIISPGMILDIPAK